MNPEERRKQVLLVEGKNDLHVITALCQAHNIQKTFDLYDCGSDDLLLKRLKSLLRAPSEDMPLEVIGVVLDTDFPENAPNLAARWQQIQTILAPFGYLLPLQPAPGGTVLEAVPNRPRLGFWFMPNNREPGMLEDFLMPLARPQALTAAQDCVGQAEAQGLTRFKQVHRSKAVLHTYLAWQDEPGKPLGQAVTAHALRHDQEIAESFTHWLNCVFVTQF